jgi:hypothetical protein
MRVENKLVTIGSISPGWPLLAPIYRWAGLQDPVGVVGMTYGACQGPGNMPAGVPGVSTALA